MKNLSFIFLALIGLTFFASCEKKDYSSFPPTWKGFDIPTSVAPGKHFKVIALQEKKGQHIEGTDYYWQLIVPNTENKNDTLKWSQHTNYDGTSNADPEASFTMPLNAKPGSRATVKFQAEYRYYGNGISVSNGSSYEGGDHTIAGTIRCTQSSLTAGRCVGNVNITIASE